MYMSLLGAFPASKFSLVYFNPEEGESKRLLPNRLFNKILEEAINVQFPQRKDYFNGALLVSPSFSIRLA